MDTKFGAVHRAVLMLDNFKCPLPPQLRAQFNNAPHRLVCTYASLIPSISMLHAAGNGPRDKATLECTTSCL